MLIFEKLNMMIYICRLLKAMKPNAKTDSSFVPFPCLKFWYRNWLWWWCVLSGCPPLSPLGQERFPDAPEEESEEREGHLHLHCPQAWVPGPGGGGQTADITERLQQPPLSQVSAVLVLVRPMWWDLFVDFWSRNQTSLVMKPNINWSSSVLSLCLQWSSDRLSN